MSAISAVVGAVEHSDFSRLPMRPLVSVLMLTYRHEAYLAEAIEGVLAQRVDFPIELIVADDGSRDGSLEIALRFHHERPDVVRIVTGLENVGARANRRRASTYVRGEFLAFCEGDDYWTDSQKLQKQVDWLRANPAAGAVHTDFDHLIRIAGSWRVLRNFLTYRFAAVVPHGNVYSDLLRGNFIQTCTLCVRSAIYRTFLAEFLKDSYPVVDWPLSIFVAAQYPIGYINQSAAVYRRVPGSIMNSGPSARSRMIEAQIDMMEDICDRMNVMARERIEALRNLYRHLMSTSLFAGDEAGLDKAIAWLKRNDPQFASAWRRRVLPIVAKIPLVPWFLAKVQDLRERIIERRRYRLITTHT